MSAAETNRSVQFEHIPRALRETPQWVCWAYEQRGDHTTKVPINPKDGTYASSTNRETWGTFEEAVGAWKTTENLAGVGFVFSESGPYCGIDLDHCLNPGKEFLWGEDLVETFDCYTEVSPSGTGVKLFFQGRKPAYAGSVLQNIGRDGSGRLEIYDRGRFFTVTGQLLAGRSTEMPDRQEALDLLCSAFWSRGSLTPPTSDSPVTPEDPDALERRAIAYLEAMPAAISGQGGHNATYAAATALVHGFGLEPDRAFRLLWQHYNGRCLPAWTAKELEHKIHSAATKEHRRPAGWLSNACSPEAGGVDLTAFDRTLSQERAAVQPGRFGNGAAQAEKDVGPSLLSQATSVQFTRLSCLQLDEGGFNLDYLVDRTMVRGQPCLVAGPKKSLKTSIIVDLAISLATGADFLGHLAVRTACRVAVMSGESGLATLQETARRVSQAKELSLRDIGGLIWSPDLPKFGRAPHWNALHNFLTNDQVEVLFVDPAYLSLPGADAGNLFIQGELFQEINQFCQEHGVTMVLAHHLRKNLVDAFRPPELEDIAWAGFQEWARQWMLVGRRERFEPGTGEHRLWLNIGGSAGHSALWSLDVNEGVFDGFTPRRWEVVVRRAEEVRQDLAVEREAAKERSRQQRLDQDKEAIRGALVRMPGCKGTKTDIRSRCGRNGQAFNLAFAELLDSGEIVPCDVEKDNGKRYAGFTCVEERNV